MIFKILKVICLILTFLLLIGCAIIALEEFGIWGNSSPSALDEDLLILFVITILGLSSFVVQILNFRTVLAKDQYVDEESILDAVEEETESQKVHYVLLGGHILFILALIGFDAFVWYAVMVNDRTNTSNELMLQMLICFGFLFYWVFLSVDLIRAWKRTKFVWTIRAQRR